MKTDIYFFYHISLKFSENEKSLIQCYRENQNTRLGSATIFFRKFTIYE